MTSATATTHRKLKIGAIGALNYKRVRPFLSVKTALQIYHALIRRHFDYCSCSRFGANVALLYAINRKNCRTGRLG